MLQERLLQNPLSLSNQLLISVWIGRVSIWIAGFAAVLSKLGREEEARAALDDLLAHAPEMSCAKYRENPFTGSEAMERLVDGLREAGIPE